jgi:hypothetical protein
LDEKEQKLRRMKSALVELERDIQMICPERHFNPFTCETVRPRSIITGKTMYLDRSQPVMKASKYVFDGGELRLCSSSDDSD